MSLVLIVLFAQAQFPSPDSLVRAADSAHRVASLAGTITRSISSFDEPGTELYGKFYWQDNNYRFDFSEPEELHVVFDGSRIIIDRPARHETTIREVAGSLEPGYETASPWLPSLRRLSVEYAFELVGHGPVEGQPVWVLEGTAADTARRPARLMLWLDQASLQVLRMETYGAGENPTTIFLVDSSATIGSALVPVRFRNWLGVEGDAIEVETRLSGIRAGVPIPDSLFRLELPGEKKEP